MYIHASLLTNMTNYTPQTPEIQLQLVVFLQQDFTGLLSILGEARTTANEARQGQPSCQERQRDFNLGWGPTQ